MLALVEYVNVPCMIYLIARLESGKGDSGVVFA